MTGSMSIRLAASLTIALALILAGSAPVGADAEARAAASETPGVYDFLVTGFRPRDTASTWLTGPSQQVIAGDEERSDGASVISFSRRIPRHYEPGAWALTLKSRLSGREATAYVDLPARGPDISLAISQPSGAPGTILGLASTEFQPGEVVSFWANGPDGTGYPGDYVIAAPTGRVDFTYTIPADAPTGAWTISAYGETSDHFGVAAFTSGQ